MKVRELPGTNRLAQKYPAFSELTFARAAHFSLRLLLEPSLLQQIQHQKFVEAELANGIEEALAGGNRSVVQIGANDGKRDDPIRNFLAQKNGIRALLVEPHPVAFNSLAALYKNRPNTQLANVAVSRQAGPLELYSPEVPGSELYASAWTCRSREQAEHELRKGMGSKALSDYSITTLSLDAITAAEVLNQSSMNPGEVAVLVCDTEGQDADVVDSFLDAGAQPDVVFFEQLHVDRSPLEGLKNRLDLLGYGLIETTKDVLAMLPQTLEASAYAYAAS